MSLILDASVSGTASNAYATYASCTDIISMYIHKVGNWNSLSTANAEACIILATYLEDSQIDYVGEKASENQALRWPRAFVIDPDGYDIDSETIPGFLQKSTALYAYELSQDDRTLEASTYGFKELDAGSLKMVIDKYDRKPVMPSVVWDLLKFYGSKLSGRTRVLVRR